MTSRQRRRAESRELAWISLRESERARYLPRDLVRICVIEIREPEEEPVSSLESEPT